MKLLGLLRHAKSDWDDIALRDFDRGLNDRGRRGAELIGAHIAKYGVKWDRILASPAQRVKSTLESSGLVIPTAWEERAYLADSDALVALVKEQSEQSGTESGAGGSGLNSLLITAHNPGLQELALRLDSGENDNRYADQICIKYPTASFAVLKLDIDDWADCRPGCGTIVHFMRPRDINPKLGPTPSSQ